MAARARGRTKSRPGFRRGLALRLLFVIPFIVLAGGLSIAVSGANMLRSVRPDLAMNFQPLDARASARAAEQLIVRSRGNPAAIDQAERLSLDALRRDTTVALAWRTLGLVALSRNQADRAAFAFRFAGTLSKRDLPTQLWLIEERVRADDIPGALVHYDIALRTNEGSHDVLLPILVSATAQDNIVPAIARTLNTLPPWRRAYLARLAADAPNPQNAALLYGLILPRATDSERQVVIGAMRAMVARRQFGAARRVYQFLTRTDASAMALLRNPSFDQPNRYAPLDWRLREEPDLTAEQRSAGDGRPGARLQVSARNGVGGNVAQQLLFLPPGAYRIGALAGTVPGNRPARFTWSIQCGGVHGANLMHQQWPPLAAQIAPAAAFVVPAAGCEAQWLNLNVQPDFGPGGAAGWVDSLTLRRSNP